MATWVVPVICACAAGFAVLLAAVYLFKKGKIGRNKRYKSKDLYPLLYINALTYKARDDSVHMRWRSMLVCSLYIASFNIKMIKGT